MDLYYYSEIEKKRVDIYARRNFYERMCYDVRRDWNEKRRNNINPNPIIVDGKPARIYDGEYPLTGILKCPQCGAGIYYFGYFRNTGVAYILER